MSLYQINQVQPGDVVMALKTEKRGKGNVCYGIMYNVVRVQLIQSKTRALTNELGLILAQTPTHWVDWNGKPGLWPLEYFKICYRPKPLFIESLKKKPSTKK
jgi:hypothetical protein